MFSKLFGLKVEEGASSHVYLSVSPEVKNTTAAYFHNCKSKKSYVPSYDIQLQELLWKESERKSGFKFL